MNAKDDFMRVLLECFVDFVLTTGLQRVAIVQAHKRHGEAPPDFFRPLRGAIETMHQEGRGPDALSKLLAGLTDARHQRAYPPIVAGYQKMLEVSMPSWFRAPRGSRSVGSLEVVAAPSLGLMFGGSPHLVELYLGKSPCSAKRLLITLALLSITLADLNEGAVMAVLDVRRARLHTLKTPSARLPLLLAGEAAAFSRIHQGL